MKKILVLLFCLPLYCRAQHVFKTDLDHFWAMRDSVLATADTARQLDIVNRLYIAKASDGLKAFMRNKDDLAGQWLRLIRAAPAFWDSLRMRMPEIGRAVFTLEKQVRRFQRLYPDLQPAQTYFLVGLQHQGGTIRGNLSLLGVEVVLSDPAMKGDQLVRMGIHEYTHTQQKRPDFQKIDVLTSSVREGACDFVSELVTGIPVKTPYMVYGSKHERDVWVSFQKEMHTRNNDNWVSTGNNPALPASDLGYFVGYQICKTYYNKTADRKAALKAIIELDYGDSGKVDAFLKASGYDGSK